MKKIAFIDLLFHWPATGGSWNDFFNVALGLQKRGFKVKLFVPDFNSYFPRGQITEDFPLDIERIPFNKYSFNFFNMPREFLRRVKKFDPDFIFMGDGYFLKPYIIKALSKWPLLLRFYSYELICLNNKLFYADREVCKNSFFEDSKKCSKCRFQNANMFKQMIKIILDYKVDEYPFSKVMFHFSQEYIASMAFRNSYKDLLAESISGASSVLVYNDYIRDILVKHNKDVRIIPSGVDTEKFRPPAEKRKKGKKKILMSGRVAEYAKGLTVLENAFKLLLSKRDDIILEITTDEYFRHFENRFQGENFILTKWVDQDGLPSVYRDADIVVVPSIWMEPFGIVAVEAMASGVPVIASRVGGLQNIVVDGETGFLFEPGNVIELMEKLEILLDNSVLREAMGKKGRGRVQNLYSWDKIVDNYYIPLFS